MLAALPLYFDSSTNRLAQSLKSGHSGAIILMSDGRRTVGPDPLDAAKLAADRGVRVFTVGFGTKEGGMVGARAGLSTCVSTRKRCRRLPMSPVAPIFTRAPRKTS